MSERIAVGIDVGTTTVSAAAVDIRSGKCLEKMTVQSGADLSSPYEWDRRQDADVIFLRAKELLDSLLISYPSACAIGFTGQMHGIVYTDKSGEALSPLYTWQDGRAGLSPDGEKSTCRILLEKTGYNVPAGYGLATHAHLLRRGEVPRGTYKICTAADHVVSRLCGSAPLCHASNAASLGFFDIYDGCFDKKALEAAGIDAEILPEAVTDYRVAGEYRGIPVAVAIGDNQAAVYGTVGERCDTAVANVGTGAQISLVVEREEAKKIPTDPDIEIRPYVGGKFLAGGASLCGGRAYADLEKFFRSYAVSAGYGDEKQYEIMEKLAARGMEQAERCPERVLSVSTLFCGNRTDPGKRGSILNIGEDNFTPEALTAGVLLGIADELYGMFLRINNGKAVRLAASGNAVRKNKYMLSALEKTFSVKAFLPENEEEAACGAALFASKTV